MKTKELNALVEKLAKRELETVGIQLYMPSKKDDKYIIVTGTFKNTVWGETIEDAVNALKFLIKSILQSFLFVDIEKISESAIEFRTELENLIKQVQNG